MSKERIRNFCIIAHVDHGKSTLADRLLEATSALSAREMKEQVLDQMDLERERGITIKLQAVRLSYQAADGREYLLNLIDTPGHVDFSYEVSRSLAACEGALLVVDAAQGVEAQTLANTLLALEEGLVIIPVINKIDLPGADPARVEAELQDLLGPGPQALCISAREGLGIGPLLEAVVARVPAPPADQRAEDPLQALVFDSSYDRYRGVVAYIRVMAGTVRPGEQIKFMATGKVFTVAETGVFKPAKQAVPALEAGEVGYLVASIKNAADAAPGDTVTGAARPAARPLPGYRRAVPMVFCGLFPRESEHFEALREAVERLKLNDAAFSYEPEKSNALGLGFRCGFLGLLHMDIVRERLEREYGLNLIISAPSVVYRVRRHDGSVVEIDNPALMPPPSERAEVEEPYVDAVILVPTAYLGPVMELCEDKRGLYRDTVYLDPARVRLLYRLPLAEIVYDFFDQLKSRTRGYATLDYELKGYHRADLAQVDILVNNEKVDALSFIVHRSRAARRGREAVERLKEIIPRQLFDVPLQAAVDSRIEARETVKALRKNVTEKLYGGDVTRKRKLLDKQKEGKRKMKRIGRVDIPREAFTAVLKAE